MKKQRLIENLFKKETYINGVKATYEDLLYLFRAIELQVESLKKVLVTAKKMFVYTY